LKSGIVMEVDNRKATLLMKDGTFVTVKIPKGKTALVGREYQASYFSERKRSLFMLPSLSLSAAALAAFLFLSGMVPFGYQSAVAAYISFDINPSIEVGVDNEMKVVQIEAFNDDARAIIEEYDLSEARELQFIEFADQLIEAYQSEGYLQSDRSMLITTVASEKSNELTESELDKAVHAIVRNTVISYPVSITVTETSAVNREKAKKLGVSAGKYSAFQKSNNKKKPMVEKKIKDVSIQEIQKKMPSAPNDIKVVPHPRKIEPSSHVIKNEQKIVPVKIDKKTERKQHDHNNHQHTVTKHMDKETKLKTSKRNPAAENKAQNDKTMKNNGQEKKQKVQEITNQLGKNKDKIKN
jgi:hypothetical protein